MTDLYIFVKKFLIELYSWKFFNLKNSKNRTLLTRNIEDIRYENSYHTLLLWDFRWSL